jgi:predicted dehydrogenase
LANVAGRVGAFDVISICSPTTSHAADLEAALELRPKLIFCEKPVTASLELTRGAVELCLKTGVLLAVNHTRRWAPDVIRLKDELDMGVWGTVRSVAAIYNKGVLNNGGHMFDLLHFLFGPLELLFAGLPVYDFWEDDPSIPAILRTSTDIPVTLNVAHAADYAHFEMQIVASGGIISMENGGISWRRRRTIDSPHFRDYKALDSGDSRAGEYSLAMGKAVANIYEAIAGGAVLASSGVTALAAQEICHSVGTMASLHSEGRNPSMPQFGNNQ